MTNKLDSIRRLAYARCKGYCELCGRQLATSFALHHRKLKSRGGKDEISNFVALHHECHNLGTHAVHLNVTKATESGHIVPSWANPSECPVILANGDSVILTDEGTYQYERKANGW